MRRGVRTPILQASKTGFPFCTIPCQLLQGSADLRQELRLVGRIGIEPSHSLLKFNGHFQVVRLVRSIGSVNKVFCPIQAGDTLQDHLDNALPPGPLQQLPALPISFCKFLEDVHGKVMLIPLGKAFVEGSGSVLKIDREGEDRAESVQFGV